MSDIPQAVTPTIYNPSYDLALPPDVIRELKKPEDFEQVFQDINEKQNQYIWWQADLAVHYYKKFLEPLDIYRAGQLLSISTVRYYMRTSAGFPPEHRLPSISFNHHYQATFADEFDGKKLRFKGDKRFMYIEQAADEGLSARALYERVSLNKKLDAKKEQILGCIHCFSKEGEVSLYAIYRHGHPKSRPLKIFLHPKCYQEVIEFLRVNPNIQPL